MVYDGWGNSRFEAMAWHQKSHGLKPIGPHRMLENRMFAGTSKGCESCSARGYFDAPGGRTFEVCPKCEGAGYLSTVTEETRSALRAEVLAEFPEAEAPSDLPNPAFSVIIQDLERNVMIATQVPRNG